MARKEIISDFHEPKRTKPVPDTPEQDSDGKHSEEDASVETQPSEGAGDRHKE